ncbi:hypothetical protein BJ742DRAFT_835985 [Cladochytrium replicatum]|nr:hypothetical protein BJ742DRAFT_835985 [Cladochytrium replicatum]
MVELAKTFLHNSHSRAFSIPQPQEVNPPAWPFQLHRSLCQQYPKCYSFPQPAMLHSNTSQNQGFSGENAVHNPLNSSGRLSPTRRQPKPAPSKPKLLLRLRKLYASNTCLAFPLLSLSRRYAREYHTDLLEDCKRFATTAIRSLDDFLACEGYRFFLTGGYGVQEGEKFVIDPRMRDEIAESQDSAQPKGKKRKRAAPQAELPRAHENASFVREGTFGRKLDGSLQQRRHLHNQYQFVVGTEAQAIQVERNHIEGVRHRILHIVPNHTRLLFDMLLLLYRELFGISVAQALGGVDGWRASLLLEILDPQRRYFQDRTSVVGTNMDVTDNFFVVVNRSGEAQDDFDDDDVCRVTTRPVLMTQTPGPQVPMGSLLPQRAVNIDSDDIMMDAGSDSGGWDVQLQTVFKGVKRMKPSVLEN